MLRSTPHLFDQPRHGRSVLGGFLGVSALLALALVVASQLVFGQALVPFAAFAIAMTLAVFGLAQGYPHRVLGACNVVTLVRLAMVAFLSGALVAPDASEWVFFGVASLAFALDGLDGWLARRSGLVSDFGARLDMETDAALGAVIATWVLVSGTAGAEVLVLGFMRYAFLAAAFFVPALRAPLPQAFRRKAICVVQIAALLILVFPLTPGTLVVPVSVAAALLLTWSFLIDTVWLLRRAA
ncbi:phosphatidylglycerophosphate synthase [Litoreibacter ponti]|uniref:Phosphatidylglycerophosphate synthase n=1 Tax=Litoreibacter ponti TaxID=1510457 RepID=A0A2T6BEM3_9RHOB|nr:CDP-alcohol phosphatidyltransferase family protein [Litoreibacter ponti]PTX54513.1 phosphatidylglycerophosphate synthase [Litoreibacter ponti]